MKHHSRLALIAATCALGGVAFAAVGSPPPSPDPADALRAQLAKERKAWKAERTALLAKHRDRVNAVVRTRLNRPSAEHALRLAATAYGLPYRGLRNVAYCESRLNPKVVNRTPIWNGEHATGLMQFIPSTWATTPYARFSILDGYANALAGAWLISRTGWRLHFDCQPSGIPRSRGG